MMRRGILDRLPGLLPAGAQFSQLLFASPFPKLLGLGRLHVEIEELIAKRRIVESDRSPVVKTGTKWM